MADLDIYNPPPTMKPAKEPSSTGYFRSRYEEYTKRVSTAINEKKAFVKDTEEKVLKTLRPVTRFSPISYDTVKRVSIITLCTYSGVLQGRTRAGFRRLFYPLVGFTAGNTACYPAQTYSVSCKVLTTGLPIIASAGKASVEVGSAMIYKGSKGVATIYGKVAEQFNSSQSERSRDHDSNTESEDDTLYEVEIMSEEVTQVSRDLEELIISDVTVEAGERISETAEVSAADVSDQVVTESLADESSSEMTSLAESSEPADEMPSDKIIPVEEIVLPEGDIEVLKGSLGMGDTEHDDMYSTRSSRP